MSVTGAVMSVMKAIGVSATSVLTKEGPAHTLSYLSLICHRTNILHRSHQAKTRKLLHLQVYLLVQMSSILGLSNLLHFRLPATCAIIQSNLRVADFTASRVLVEFPTLNLETMISVQAATRNSFHPGASVQKTALMGGAAACMGTA